MACCCKEGRPNATSCLGRCDLPKHKCIDREEIKPGPVPKYMGWLWDARDSPEHQLRCGWRPGHISCPVLRRIEQHNCCIRGDCQPCAPCPPCPIRCFPRPPCNFPRIPCNSPRPPCNSPRPPCHSPRPPCSSPRPPCNSPRPPCTSPRARCNSCCPPSKSCIKIDGCSPTPCLPSPPSCTKPPSYPGQSIIRIVRHGGNYTISTEPSSVSNAPSGPYPLKYVLNTDDDKPVEKAKYCVEAKFNDYHFDYTTSQTSFVLDFSPPEQKCHKPCPKRSISCLSGSDTSSK